MSTELRILFLEDSLQDAELEERELRQGGLDFVSKRVETREEFIRALDEFEPDLIISDYSLPQMDGPGALSIAKQLRPDVPFIFVSGTIGEERAIESLKSGAVDYVVKDRLASLVFKAQRALREADERKELRKLEAQLQAAQKMEAVGRLAGGVAHDFNNLLTVIEGYSRLLFDRFGPSDPEREELEEVLRACERAASLTRQLMAFSRNQIIAPAVINLNTTVTEVEKMLRRLIGEDVVLRTALDPELANVWADRGQVEQIIMNLAVNARDAMPNGGTLTIETGNVLLDETFTRQHPGSKSGPHVVLSMTDTGQGMDETTVSHIFEPFFTTKEQGKGTGLGLATVYGIVKQGGGYIGVDSELGKGTTIKIYFPRVDEPVEPSKPRQAVPGSLAGKETVLLVEDSKAVRKLVSRVLKKRGYTLLTAADGEEALELIQTYQGTIDLLITDIVMPRVGGRELANRMAQLRPDTKVLYISGYMDRSSPRNGIVVDGMDFLHKPFTPEELARKLREVLSGR